MADTNNVQPANTQNATTAQPNAGTTPPAPDNAQIKLILSEKPTSIDLEEIKIIKVDTDADDFQVVSSNDSVKVQKTMHEEAGITYKAFKLIGVEQGFPARITVGVTVDGVQKIDDFFCQCALVPTSLVVQPVQQQVAIGQKLEVPLETNAASYTVTFGNKNVLRIAEQHKNKLVLEAIGLGSTTVNIAASKKYSVTKTHQFPIVVAKALAMSADNQPASFTLLNPSTLKKVTFTTTNDKSSGDVTLYLPERSGQLLIEEQIGSEIGVIAQPAIIAPYNKMVEYNGEFAVSPYKPLLSFSEELLGAKWEVSLNSTFTDLVLTKTVDGKAFANNGYATKFDLTGAFFFRVKYITKSFESVWSDPVEVALGINLTPGNPKPLKIVYQAGKDETYSKLQSGYNGAYFGKVQHSELVDDYDYRGNIETIVKHYKKANAQDNRDLNKLYNLVNGGTQKLSERFPGLTSAESNLMPIYFRKGNQVTYKGKLYYATANMKNTSTTGDGSEVILPDNPDKSKNKWKEDTRTNLGTPRHVFWSRCNIGFGNKSGTASGYFTGDESIGNLINHQEGYLKYMYKGRICFTTPKPICDKISWNDIAFVELWKKQRTVRLGGLLYYVRLMYEEEFRTLFDRLADGTYLARHEYKESDYSLSSKVWLYDERFLSDDSKKPVRKAISKSGGAWVVEDVDPKVRPNMCLRLVLEYCEESSAPYNNLVGIYGNIISAANERLQYDPYTDTGYFGTTAQGAFGTENQLKADVGVTSSSNNYDNGSPHWLKFYWHGLVLYTPKKQLTNNHSYNHSVNSGTLVGVDCGNRDGKKVLRDGKFYRVSNMLAWSHHPMRFTQYYYAGSYTSEPVENLFTEQNHYSMYQELLLRVCRGYAGLDMSSLPGDEITGGDMARYDMQCGDNWDEYTQVDLTTQNNKASGSYRRSREQGTYNGSPNYSGGYGYCNILYSHLAHTFAHAGAYSGWSPVLIPDMTNESRSEV